MVCCWDFFTICSGAILAFLLLNITTIFSFNVSIIVVVISVSVTIVVMVLSS